MLREPLGRPVGIRSAHLDQQLFERSQRTCRFLRRADFPVLGTPVRQAFVGAAVPKITFLVPTSKGVQKTVSIVSIVRRRYKTPLFQGVRTLTIVRAGSTDIVSTAPGLVSIVSGPPGIVSGIVSIEAIGRIEDYVL